VISLATKLILPGVGSFDSAMTKLRKRGFIPLLNEMVLERKVPILGICQGVQLFTRTSQEGRLPGLGWIEAGTVRFEFGPENARLTIPHMGCNFIEPAKPAVLLNGLPPKPRFYFVHSDHLVCDEPNDVLTWTTHGYRFASAIQRGNVRGMQFHPHRGGRCRGGQVVP